MRIRLILPQRSWTYDWIAGRRLSLSLLTDSVPCSNRSRTIPRNGPSYPIEHVCPLHPNLFVLYLFYWLLSLLLTNIDYYWLLLTTIDYNWLLLTASLFSFSCDYRNFTMKSESDRRIAEESCSKLRPSLSGRLLLIYIWNFHVLSHLLLIYICKLHWNLNTIFILPCQTHRRSPPAPVTPCGPHR